MGKPSDWAAVEVTARDAETNGGTIGYAMAWNGVIVAERHGHRPFRAASTVKILIMVELYRQVDAGTLNLD